jgi:hypothetical protein
MNYKDLQYRLRCHTKRTDLPSDVLRDIGEAYAEIADLSKRIIDIQVLYERLIEVELAASLERDEARRELCRNEAIIRLQRHRVHRDSEDVVGLAKEIAVERGWDCFKENADV